MCHTSRIVAIILAVSSLTFGLTQFPPSFASASLYGAGCILQTPNPRRVADKTLPAVVPVVCIGNTHLDDSFGSGFFIRRDIVATCYHVVKDAMSVGIKLNGTFISCGVVEVDPENDLALLKPRSTVNPKSILTISSMAGNDIGDSVFAIGNPKGLSGTFTQGIISSFRKVRSGTAYVQFTAPVSSGSSGGPLVDGRGQVIGVVTMTLRDAQNLNFAVSANHLKIVCVIG